jgi:copper chaperone CopZ
MVSATFKVTGMTCDHCARAVTQELIRLDGVTDVAVELVPGGVSAVTVSSEVQLSGDAVAAALDEAGEYHLAGA